MHKARKLSSLQVFLGVQKKYGSFFSRLMGNGVGSCIIVKGRRLSRVWLWADLSRYCSLSIFKNKSKAANIFFLAEKRVQCLLHAIVVHPLKYSQLFLYHGSICILSMFHLLHTCYECIPPVSLTKWEFRGTILCLFPTLSEDKLNWCTEHLRIYSIP